MEVQYTDGTSDELVVGNEAGESAGRYILKDGIVYISSSFSGALLETPLYFINTEIYSVADRTEETVDSEGFQLHHHPVGRALPHGAFRHPFGAAHCH